VIIRITKVLKGLVTLMIRPTRPGETRGTTVRMVRQEDLREALVEGVDLCRQQVKLVLPESSEGSP